MTLDDRIELLSTMETMLGQCRRRIKVAELAADLKAAAQVLLLGLPVICGGFLFIRLLGAAVPLPAVMELYHALLATAVFALVVFGRAIVLGLFGRPVHMKAAAERLDLSQGTHNRIATAMDLLRSDDDSPFAALAIREGYELLEKLQAKEPHIDVAAASWQRGRLLVVASLVMLVAGQFLWKATPDFPGPSVKPGDRGNQLAERIEPTTSSDDSGETKPRSETVNPKTLGGAPKVTPEQKNPQAGRRADKPQKAESAGPLAENASGKARDSKSSSTSRSTSGAAGVKAAEGKDNKPPGKRRPKKSAKKTKPPRKKKPDQSKKKGGSISSRGSSGKGTMQTEQNDWQNKVKGKATSDDDINDEDEPDEDPDPRKQRAGKQPSLKNRAARISRELSLMMGKKPKNNANRGRGGPSAGKKARGTATMIMGVPVPGFVKGTLMPGPTKSTQEKVTPTPRKSDYAKATVLQPVQAKEVPVERFRPVAEMAARARDFLIQFHAKHENKKKDSTEND